MFIERSGMGGERTEKQLSYALASIIAYAIYALAHAVTEPSEAHAILYALAVAIITWIATARDNIQPSASKTYVLIRYVLFSILCLALAALKFAGAGLK